VVYYLVLKMDEFPDWFRQSGKLIILLYPFPSTGAGAHNAPICL
jgi:hypothetical protein